MMLPSWEKIPVRVRSMIHLSIITTTGAFATVALRGKMPTTWEEAKHDLVGALTAAILAEMILLRSLALQALRIVGADPIAPKMPDLDPVAVDSTETKVTPGSPPDSDPSPTTKDLP